MNANVPKGRRGEDIAADFLEKQGFAIIERNWRFSRLGELDIIARDGDTLVFVEVKARSSSDFGHPLESINPRKLERIRKLAEIYLGKSNLCYKNIRIDIIGILTGENNEIFHLRNV